MEKEIDLLKTRALISAQISFFMADVVKDMNKAGMITDKEAEEKIRQFKGVAKANLLIRKKNSLDELEAMDKLLDRIDSA